MATNKTFFFPPKVRNWRHFFINLAKAVAKSRAVSIKYEIHIKTPFLMPKRLILVLRFPMTSVPIIVAQTESLMLKDSE